MSEPKTILEPAPQPDAEHETRSCAAQARPIDDDGPHAGATLDLPMSSPD
jgi:hypothetical protein